MSEPERMTITVGAAGEERQIATLARPGGSPGVFWLGGFRSDMSGTKAAAIDHWCAAAGIASTRFDYSGHGQSSGRFVDGTISSWLEDALAVFDRLTSGDQILVGSSMGGWIALLLARALRTRVGSEQSRIKGMVFIAPAPDFTERLMWATFSQAVRDEITETGVYSEPSAYSSEPTVVTRSLIEDGRKHLLMDGRIELGCPVHILQGAKDADVPWRHAIDLATCFSGADVTLSLIKDGDHRLSRPEDIARITDALFAMTQ